MKPLKLIALSIICLMSITQLHAEVKSLNIHEFEKLKKKGAKIIDIRHQEDIDKTGIIPGSYRLNFYKEDGSMNRYLWLRQFVTLVKAKYVKFVLISNTGKDAKRGAEILHAEKGYINPYYLEGGFQTWVDNGNKVIKK